MLRISSSPIHQSQAVGFTLKFANGWTVSVQFGDHNYCNNNLNRQSSLEIADGYAERERQFLMRCRHGNNTERVNLEDVRCDNAEVAAWDSNEEWYDFGTNTVKGYLNADEVSDFIHMIRNLEENYNETIK
jgi:hypothetical protein